MRRPAVLLLTLLLATDPAQAFWGALSKVGKLADEAADVGKSARGADEAARTARHSDDIQSEPDATASEVLGVAKDLGDLGQLGAAGNTAANDDHGTAPLRSKTLSRPASPQSTAEWLGWSLGIVLGLALFLLPFWLLWRVWRWWWRRA